MLALIRPWQQKRLEGASRFRRSGYSRRSAFRLVGWVVNRRGRVTVHQRCQAHAVWNDHVWYRLARQSVGRGQEVMGLLDQLFSGNSGGGLLDFLNNNALNQPMQGGLPSDQAQYGQPMNAMAQAPAPIFQSNQPSPLDNAQWPAGPNGAPSQANAQMPQQQMQPQQAAMPQQSSGPGLGDRLGASLQSFANSGGPLPALANGITSLISGQRTDPTGVAERQKQQVQNQTLQALIQRGSIPLLHRPRSEIPSY